MENPPMIPPIALALCSGLLTAFACTPLGGAAAEPPPQPVTAAVGIRLAERGALLIEDFDAPEMNSKIWRRAQRDADRTTFGQRGGRLELTARGSIGMNGYWGLGGVKAKDVVLVGEMDIRSTGSQPHRLALHLCGGDGKRSPDHWAEVIMVDLGDMVRFSVGAALPEGFARRENQSLELPHPPGQGFLCRIDLNGETNLAELWVKAADGWKRISEPIHLPLRTVHAEAKFNGNHATKSPASPGETTSRAWFDNVRIYPRPQSHYVGINLLRENGGEIWVREGGRGWPPLITDAAGKKRKISELTVELRTEDGAQLVASSQSQNFGFHLLPLKDAPWDVYPAAAQIVVLLDGKPLGRPQRIERHGCHGLYPDDVYEIVIE